MSMRTRVFLLVFAAATAAALLGVFSDRARRPPAEEASPQATSAPRAATATPAAGESTGPHSVMYTVDGDTVFVSVDGRRESVRLIGIDTPEVATPNNPASECYGEEARERLRGLLRGSEVYLVGDAEASERDSYGRLLRYLLLPDGTHVNALLVKEGYAEVFRAEPFALKAAFLEHERAAREARRGRWGACR